MPEPAQLNYGDDSQPLKPVAHMENPIAEALGERVRIKDLFADPDSFDTFDSQGSSSGPPVSDQPAPGGQPDINAIYRTEQETLTQMSQDVQLASRVVHQADAASRPVIENMGFGAPASSTPPAGEQAAVEAEPAGLGPEMEYAKSSGESDWLKPGSDPVVDTQPASDLVQRDVQQLLSGRSISDQLASGVQDEVDVATRPVIENMGFGAPASSIPPAGEQAAIEAELPSPCPEIEYVEPSGEPDWLELDVGQPIADGGYVGPGDPDPFIY